MLVNIKLRAKNQRTIYIFQLANKRIKFKTFFKSHQSYCHYFKICALNEKYYDSHRVYSRVK